MAKIMLNGVNYSDTSGVSGVKGNNETTYRTGNVNLTPENIGAFSAKGGTINGDLNINGSLKLNEGTNHHIACVNNKNELQPLKLYAEPLILDTDMASCALETNRSIFLKGLTSEIQFTNTETLDGDFISNPTKISNKDITTRTAKFTDFHCETFTFHYGGFATPCYPNKSNTYVLGTASLKWKQLFANTSVISTSDRNLKKDIQNLDDKWIKFFMLLQPKSYLFKDGESGRTHVGFISQDVEEALEACRLTSLDFAGFCKDQKVERKKEIEKITHPANEETGEPEWIEEKEKESEQPVFDEAGNPVYIYSLRYEEFIALNTMMIQKLYNQNQIFENRLSKIEQHIYTKNES